MADPIRLTGTSICPVCYANGVPCIVCKGAGRSSEHVDVPSLAEHIRAQSRALAEARELIRDQVANDGDAWWDPDWKERARVWLAAMAQGTEVGEG